MNKKVKKMQRVLGILCGMLLLTPASLLAQQAVVSKIEAQGGRILKLAQNDDRLEVSFHLSGREISDENLQPVAELSNVYMINLRGTSISDDGLQHLAGLKSLVRLHLEKTPVTDAGLKHLLGLENLEYLNLYDTKITDAGLEQLTALPKLKKLFLWQTQVTWPGVEAAQKRRPELQIISGLTPPEPEKPAADPAAADAKPEEKPEAKPEASK